MSLTLDQFATQLVKSELMTADDLRAFVNGLAAEKRPQDGEHLARELIRKRKLTAYQATQIYLGKLQNLTLGNYRILDKLGQGGMGLILKAEHKLLKRMVAIKVLAPSVTRQPDAMERFQREVEAISKLSHPNIVTAYDADEDKTTRFLVLEYVEGIDLADIVQQQGPLPVEQALNYLHQAAKGLEYAHQQGVIHRDIKPSNLLLDHTGVVKVLDLGLARLAESDTQFNARQAALTLTGIIMGTVDFMSPEQAENTKKADARSDLYSLGICFYYMLTGQNPYAGETLMERILAHREWPIPSIRKIRNDVCVQVDGVFRKMVAKKPADRFQSMTELIAALANCMQGEVELRTTGFRTASPIQEPREFVPSAILISQAAKTHIASEHVEFDWSPNPEEIQLKTRTTPASGVSRPTSRRTRKPGLWLSGIACLILVCVIAGASLQSRETKSDQKATRKANRSAKKPGPSKIAKSPKNGAQLSQGNSPYLSERELAEWVLTERGTIEIETDDGEARSLESRKMIPQGQFVIRKVEFRIHSLKDQDLDKLLGLQRLQVLTLTGNTSLTDNCVPTLMKLGRLTTLHVAGTQITLAGLAELPHLIELGLDRNQFSAGQVDGAAFPELRRLKLNGLDEPQIERLLTRSIPLESLILTHCSGSTKTWNSLFTKYSDLREIQIADSDFGDYAIHSLSRCQKLSKVTLNSTTLTDEGLKALARLKSLKYLNVRKTQVTRAGLQKFQSALPQCDVDA